MGETDAASLLSSCTGSPGSPTAGAGAHAAVFRSLNPGNTDATLLVEKSAFGPVGQFETPGGGDGVFVLTRTIGGNAGLRVTNISVGFAAVFSGDQKGVRIETNGGAGLQVLGGSKNAVVGTSTGARALYSEESAEVWFTDYGFARLNRGRVWVPLDPTFAETVTAGQPYHVFLPSYRDADLYVARRTFTGFEVVLRGGDPAAEFSYRIVARRRGFEHERLAPAPWADDAVKRRRESPRW